MEVFHVPAMSGTLAWKVARWQRVDAVCWFWQCLKTRKSQNSARAETLKVTVSV